MKSPSGWVCSRMKSGRAACIPGLARLTFWHFGRCDEYSPYVEEQMRQTLAPPLDVIDFCHATRTQIDIDLYMGVD